MVLTGADDDEVKEGAVKEGKVKELVADEALDGKVKEGIVLEDVADVVVLPDAGIALVVAVAEGAKLKAGSDEVVLGAVKDGKEGVEVVEAVDDVAGVVLKEGIEAENELEEVGAVEDEVAAGAAAKEKEGVVEVGAVEVEKEGILNAGVVEVPKLPNAGVVEPNEGVVEVVNNGVVEVPKLGAGV